MASIQSFNSAEIAPEGDEFYDSPVFVLTASRSGSTLLRFLLDSHPDLACPPETSIASACAGLTRSWDLLDNAGSGVGRPIHESAKLPPHVVAAVRDAVDRAFGSYLLRRGKRRWCDKSLDTFQFADLLTQIYPQAKFICLYRHCMDVIASGVEVCPWGLHRFGFDPHVAQHPGNSIAAIGSYWLSCAQTILAFEEQHPDLCHRVRYEDMVTAPEDTAAAIFSFLGVQQAPGITETCFQTAHEGEGPGDEKIWFTTGVTPRSLGRGVSVPAAALPPPMRDAINENLTKLGYRVIDDQWNSAPDGADPRANPPAPAAGVQPSANGHARHDHEEVATVLEAIAARIGPDQDDRYREIATQWPAVSGSIIALVVQSQSGDNQELRLDFRSAAANGDDPVARIIASPTTWRSLLEGKANPVTEMTAGRLRCVNKRDNHRIRSDEVHAVATLLGMASIPMARIANDTDKPAPATILRACPDGQIPHAVWRGGNLAVVA